MRARAGKSGTRLHVEHDRAALSRQAPRAAARRTSKHVAGDAPPGARAPQDVRGEQTWRGRVARPPHAICRRDWQKQAGGRTRPCQRRPGPFCARTKTAIPVELDAQAGRANPLTAMPRPVRQAGTQASLPEPRLALRTCGSGTAKPTGPSLALGYVWGKAAFAWLDGACQADGAAPGRRASTPAPSPAPPPLCRMRAPACSPLPLAGRAHASTAP